MMMFPQRIIILSQFHESSFTISQPMGIIKKIQIYQLFICRQLIKNNNNNCSHISFIHLPHVSTEKQLDCRQTSYKRSERQRCLYVAISEITRGGYFSDGVFL